MSAAAIGGLLPEGFLATLPKSTVVPLGVRPREIRDPPSRKVVRTP